MVKFSKANAKIEALSKIPELATFLANKRKVYSFDLLSGYSCPFASDCLSKVVIKNGKRKVKDGPHTQFRCFSASQEVQYTNTYNRRNENFQSIRKLSKTEIIDTISKNQPKNLGICRIHVAGDFFNSAYFDAWVQIAIDNPDRLYYAYTKSLSYWIARKSDIPSNFVLTASRGGRQDELIDTYGLREAIVVYNEPQAKSANLEIDHDDSHAACPSLKNQSFALLIHGIQPKGTVASEALKELKKHNVKHSYSRK